MKQFWEIKAQAGDAILFFRMGDFYELFDDDAVEAARILEITLTSRDKNKPNPMPMAGVPHHSVQGYIQKLLNAGKKVAIGDQVGDPDAPENAKIVRRKLSRIFTPAIQFDREGSETSYLATVVPAEGARDGARDGKRWVLGCMDSSTGEARISEALTESQLADELGRQPIKHFLRIGHLLPESAQQALARETLVEDLASNYLSHAQAQDFLKRQYGLSHLDTFLNTAEKAHALGILAVYVARTQGQERLGHLRLPAPLHEPSRLRFGQRTIQHLDLLPGPDGNPNLFDLINRTRSALGARTLKRWLVEPLIAANEIEARQAAVREIAAGALSSTRLAGHLGSVYDLERITGRITTKLAGPRDTLALGRTLALLPHLLNELKPAKTATMERVTKRLASACDELRALGERIVATQKEEAPLFVRDGGVFALGANPELDRLIRLNEDGSRWLVELETREREATGIPSLKVRYNRVFGYYIEITQSHLKNVPSHYQRKQTTVGAERFFTEELKKFEDEIVTSGSKQKSLEIEMFDELVASIHEKTSSIMDAAQSLGELDSLLALSQLAQEPGWCFPVVDESLDMQIRAGRHPLVDQASRGNFVPNDLALNPDSRRTLLITGPNMGGKSTVMRQVALIVVLGQMGAPVPAAEARWGVVSSLHTRIGAHDAISRGQSTFMVEMSELAHILHFADSRSLIVLDEIGRGTSTYDGISVAWATLEWICNKVCARTLFATHYHELTRLEGKLPGLANAHMAVEGGRAGSTAQTAASIRFLYLLKEGAANESFGVQVAQLAGLPAPVIERAWQVLADLEQSAVAPVIGDARTEQLSLWGAIAAAAAESPARAPEPPKQEPPHPALGALSELDINDLTPLQALNALARIRGMVGASHAAARV